MNDSEQQNNMQVIDYIKQLTRPTSPDIETLGTLNNGTLMYFHSMNEFHPYSVLTMHLHRQQS